MPSKAHNALISAAKDLLARRWEALEADAGQCDLSAAISKAVRRAVNSSTKSYRYVLPTQILAKATDEKLDCRCVQEGSDLTGSFDARTICRRVIVPFDRENHDVLGGSSDPYVNNPLRIQEITPAQRAALRNKKDFDALCDVLKYVEDHPQEACFVLDEVLRQIRDRLSRTRIIYPVPNRVSLKQVRDMSHQFLSDRTGGRRKQAVSAALFRALGAHLGLWNSVQSAHINAADRSTGNVADLTCIGAGGETILAVEVKDRRLALHQVQDKLPAARQAAIRELLFLVNGGAERRDQAAIDDLLDREFSTGQNIYIVEFTTFEEAAFVLLGEGGRRVFLKEVGAALDETRAEFQDRTAWRDLLSAL